MGRRAVKQVSSGNERSGSGGPHVYATAARARRESESRQDCCLAEERALSTGRIYSGGSRYGRSCALIAAPNPNNVSISSVLLSPSLASKKLAVRFCVWSAPCFRREATLLTRESFGRDPALRFVTRKTILAGWSLSCEERRCGPQDLRP